MGSQATSVEHPKALDRNLAFRFGIQPIKEAFKTPPLPDTIENNSEVNVRKTAFLVIVFWRPAQ
jgi:hypothetical protein